jgi:hypothetical protein
MLALMYGLFVLASFVNDWVLEVKHTVSPMKELKKLLEMYVNYKLFIL